MRNWDFKESKWIINPSHQIPYFNVSNTGSMWFLFSWWNWNDLYVKSCHVFWWGLLWNPQGLRRLWVESWQNEANFQQSRKWSFLYEQRQTRECFSQSGVTTAAPLPSSPAVTSFIWPHLRVMAMFWSSRDRKVAKNPTLHFHVVQVLASSQNHDCRPLFVLYLDSTISPKTSRPQPC